MGQSWRFCGDSSPHFLANCDWVGGGVRVKVADVFTRLVSLRRPCENCPVKDDFSAGAPHKNSRFDPQAKNKEQRAAAATAALTSATAATLAGKRELTCGRTSVMELWLVKGWTQTLVGMFQNYSLLYKERNESRC